MARASIGWINTTQKDNVQDFLTSNVLKSPIHAKKVQRLPPLNIQYDTPRISDDKKWTDQSLISTRSVDNYLAESDAFQRASYANIIDKWKEYDKSKTDRLLSTFDAHYNMKIRFRHDDKINRSSEMKYGSIATYYRFMGNENSRKNNKPCGRHKRLIQEYEERHVRDLLQLPTTTIKTRRPPHYLSKITELPPAETTIHSSTSVRPSVSVAEQSHHTFDFRRFSQRCIVDINKILIVRNSSNNNFRRLCNVIA
ncbi:unnamed protein product [Rotaria sp. Silwood2]|nr:unnamed protein product [Rotaria sp. Silwood2]CAF2527854.1 unnamed protein product [Rotaria sp. Silwood2]CAF2759567.1 unnamed protein product [Rotaria sp. Silwood2]CAF2937563.1 unnamed protein product [Rotaria sp. Silwood2]CAF3892799.1 unnamed protein product [Rotaria sp. Silwood2]